MINPDSQSNYAEFMVFLLIYASYADYELSINEINRLKSKFDPLLVDTMLVKYDSMSEYERLSFIMKNKSPYLSTEEDIQKILEEVKLQFESDGIYCKLEKGLNNFLEHMLSEEWN